jgi:hypothetical protein
MRRLALVFALIGCESRKESTPADSSSPSAVSPTPPAASGAGRQTVCGDEIIRGEGIGELRIGITVDAVRQRCTVVRDTTVIDIEGMPARKLAVMFAQDTVEAEIVNGRVWRLAVHSPRLRTADSLGVGTPLARLVNLKRPRGMTGEGKFFVASPDHCGMSFRLAITGGGGSGDLDSAGLARLPKSTPVSEVLVFGCRPG